MAMSEKDIEEATELATEIGTCAGLLMDAFLAVRLKNDRGSQTFTRGEAFELTKAAIEVVTKD